MDGEEGFWGVVRSILEQHGLLGLVLLFLILLFWKLIWNVWSSAMRSKDEEIERLVKEKRWLQQQLMNGTYLSSKPEDLSEDRQ